MTSVHHDRAGRGGIGAVPARRSAPGQPMTASIRDQLRDRLVEELDQQRISAKRLAQDMGISPTAFYAFLRGEPQMSIERIEEIFRHLGYDLVVETVIR